MRSTSNNALTSLNGNTNTTTTTSSHIAHLQQIHTPVKSITTSSGVQSTHASIATDTLHSHDLTELPIGISGDVDSHHARKSLILPKSHTSPNSTRRPILRKTIRRERPMMAARKTSAVHVVDSHSDDPSSEDLRPASPTRSLSAVSGD